MASLLVTSVFSSLILKALKKFSHSSQCTRNVISLIDLNHRSIYFTANADSLTEYDVSYCTCWTAQPLVTGRFGTCLPSLLKGIKSCVFIVYATVGCLISILFLDTCNSNCLWLIMSNFKNKMFSNLLLGLWNGA